MPISFPFYFPPLTGAPEVAPRRPHPFSPFQIRAPYGLDNSHISISGFRSRSSGSSWNVFTRILICLHFCEEHFGLDSAGQICWSQWRSHPCSCSRLLIHPGLIDLKWAHSCIWWLVLVPGWGTSVLPYRAHQAYTATSLSQCSTSAWKRANLHVQVTLGLCLCYPC